MNNNRGLWRGKRVEGDDWIDGYFAGYYLNDSQELTPHILSSEDGDLYEVIPSTLGECTGLRDKNGEFIFEGDIVKTLEIDSNGKHRCFPVVQSHGAFWLYDEFLDSKLDFLGGYEKEALEIIGNIYDNPELLKGEF